MTTPYDLLLAELRRDRSRPLITYYDDETGERVELSVATFDNWVAKTAGLLRDGLAVEAGGRVALMLPAHWQSAVWGMACWAVGTCAVLGETDRVDVAVTGPDTLSGAVGAAAHVVALSLRPLGARFTDPLPPGVLDFALEVPSYPDRMAYSAPDPAEPGLDGSGVAQTLGGLVAQAADRATQLGIQPGSRLLVPAEDLRTGLCNGLLVPLTVGGSSVLVRHEKAAGRQARMAAERITAVAG
jgi:uncharacterized protein (TIGR03089 family)